MSESRSSFLEVLFKFFFFNLIFNGLTFFLADNIVASKSKLNMLVSDPVISQALYFNYMLIYCITALK